MASQSVVDLLNIHSTKQYGIELGGYRSNHIAHGIIALHRLGASQKRIEQFIEWYKTRLMTPEDFARFESRIYPMTGNIEDMRGKRRGYHTILQHFFKLAQQWFVDELIRREFPKVAQGMIGAAFHGLIQLGYGFSADNEQVVCEGLAYMHHSYAPILVSDPATIGQSLWTNGDTNILDVLHLLRENKDLQHFSKKRSKEIKMKDPRVAVTGGSFPRGVTTLFAYKGDEILWYADKIKPPAFYDPTKDVVCQLDALLKWLVDCAIVVFVMSEPRNDFFLLHGVTGAWSLKEIVSILRDPAEIRRAIHIFLCCLLAAYVAQGCPLLKPEFLPTDESGMASWEDIIRSTLSTDQDQDEHVYKLVQVCHDMSKSNNDPKMVPIYKEATRVVSNYPLNLAFGYIYDKGQLVKL